MIIIQCIIFLFVSQHNCTRTITLYLRLIVIITTSKTANSIQKNERIVNTHYHDSVHHKLLCIHTIIINDRIIFNNSVLLQGDGVLMLECKSVWVRGFIHSCA